MLRACPTWSFLVPALLRRGHVQLYVMDQRRRRDRALPLFDWLYPAISSWIFILALWLEFREKQCFCSLARVGVRMNLFVMLNSKYSSPVGRRGCLIARVCWENTKDQTRRCQMLNLFSVQWISSWIQYLQHWSCTNDAHLKGWKGWTSPCLNSALWKDRHCVASVENVLSLSNV